MIDQALVVTTILAVLGSGLIAGAFFAFAAFVLPALSRLGAPSAIAAMQAIIMAIKGPLFLAVFFGTAALTALLGLAATLKWGEPGAFYLLIGSLLFLNLPFGVTLMKNLPLNAKLAAAKPDSAEGKRFWQEFRAVWGLWNHVRWIGALAAAASFVVALIEGGAPVPARE
jgi:uncharacterized membrane protein